MKLNIGCGRNKLNGYVNIDKAVEVNPDEVIDIEEGLSYDDNTFDTIFSSHCVEHIRPDKWSFVLDEIIRVAKDGCILELELPFDNSEKRCNIGHYRTFYFDSFRQHYITEKNRKYYSKWKLEPLHNEPTWLQRWFYNFFPFLKGTIYFKFKIIKETEQGERG